jgi:hypothetical protein
VLQCGGVMQMGRQQHLAHGVRCRLGHCLSAKFLHFFFVFCNKICLFFFNLHLFNNRFLFSISNKVSTRRSHKFFFGRQLIILIINYKYFSSVVSSFGQR